MSNFNNLTTQEKILKVFLAVCNKCNIHIEYIVHIIPQQHNMVKCKFVMI